MQKGFPRNSTKLTGKCLCKSLSLNKFACLRSATLLQKILWHKCFPVDFSKLLGTFFLQNTSGGMLLKMLYTITKLNSESEFV